MSLDALHRTAYNEDHEAFRQTVRRFVAEELEPNSARWDEDGIVPREVWPKAGELGLLCPTVPEAYGGLGLDFGYNAIVDEESAYYGRVATGYRPGGFNQTPAPGFFDRVPYGPEELTQGELGVKTVFRSRGGSVFRGQLAVYYGETIRNAPQSEFSTESWYKRAQRRRLEPEREAHYPVHAGLALHFVTELPAREFDVCAVKELAPGQYEGHAYSYIHRTYLGGRALPVVPVFLNTYYPPNQVSPKRCVALGRALKALIESYPQDLRVGVVASGGLSHFVVDEDIDRGVIEAMRTKNLDYLGGLDPKRLQAGSSEIRSWIVATAAAADLDLQWVEYVPAYRTPALTGTGLGFARWG